MATQEYAIKVTINGVEQAKNAINKIGAETKKTADKTKNLTEKWRDVGLAIFGVQRTIRMLTRAFNAIVEPAKTFEVMQRRLEGLYGSTERATLAFENFTKVARQTPASLEDVVEAASTLKAFGVDAEETILSVSDLAFYMGRTLPEAAEAFGRAMTLGAGGARQLRASGILQLIEDTQKIEDITNLTLPEFQKALMDTMTDVNVGIAGMSIKMVDSLEGALSVAKDSFRQTMASIGQAFTPAIAAAANLVADMGLEFAEVAKAIKLSFDDELLDELKKALKEFSKELKPLMQPMVDMFASLFGLIGKQVINTLPALSKLWNLFGKLAIALGNALIPVLDALMDVWGAVNEIVIVFVDIVLDNIPLIEDLANSIAQLLVVALRLLDPILRIAEKLLSAVADVVGEDVLPLVIELSTSLADGLTQTIESLLPVLEALATILEIAVIPVLEKVLWLVGLVAKGFNAIGRALGWTGGRSATMTDVLGALDRHFSGSRRGGAGGGTGAGSGADRGGGEPGGVGGSLSRLDDLQRRIEQFWQSVSSFEQKYMRKSIWDDIGEIVSDFNQQMSNIAQAEWLSAGEREDVTRGTLWRYYDGLLAKEKELFRAFNEFQSFTLSASEQIDVENQKQLTELDNFITRLEFLRDTVAELTEYGEEFAIDMSGHFDYLIGKAPELRNKILEITENQKLELAIEKQLAYYDLILSNIDTLGLGWQRYHEARVYQINAEIEALAKVHGWTEDLLQLQSLRLDAIAQEWAKYQEQLWLSQNETAVNAVEGIVDATLSGFRSMIDEGKSFGETMADIWRNWVDIAISEVQRLIAQLAVAAVLNNISGGVVGGASGVAGIGAALLSTGAVNPSASTPSYIDPGVMSTSASLLSEIRDLRKDIRSAMTAPVKMSWRRGEMSRAVVEDAQHVRGIA